MAEQTSAAWRCTVCGYIHRGAEPPDWCPVCGAAKADFEPYEEPAAPQAAAPAQRWQCMNCNYLHDASEPPELCPICAAAADRFRALEAREAGAAGGTRDHVAIVGAGIAGVSAAEAVRATAAGARITLISTESELPYYRLNLTRYLAGEIGADDLPIHPAGWYEDQRIEVRSESAVESIDPAEGSLVFTSGGSLAYDKLILTVGAHPFVPPFPGTQRNGVVTLRTRADAGGILEALRDDLPCVCIGGGILGIETAGALARRGAKVTMLESHGSLMPRQLNPAASEVLAEHLKRTGITLRTGARTREIVGDECAAGVLLDDGTMLAARLVVITTGVRPNSHLARRAGLEVNHGVVVNNRLETSHPGVLAAGDVAEHRGICYGTWSPAQFQGSIAGMNAAGANTEFGGMPRSNTLKVLGVDLLSTGQFEADDGSFDVIESREGDTYRRFVFRDGQLRGAILLGDASLSAVLRKAIENRTDFSELLRQRPSAEQVSGHMQERA